MSTLTPTLNVGMALAQVSGNEQRAERAAQRRSACRSEVPARPETEQETTRSRARELIVTEPFFLPLF